LDIPEFKGPAENYCKHCTDERGNLKGREEIQEGIAQWLMGWQPQLDRSQAMQRASYFMKSMPAWAD
jgi:hypothetical protein